MENCIPKFWEREREWKVAFPTFRNGNGNEKLIPKFWEREREAGIPGNGREREFPLTPVSDLEIAISSPSFASLFPFETFIDNISLRDHHGCHHVPYFGRQKQPWDFPSIDFGNRPDRR